MRLFLGLMASGFLAISALLPSGVARAGDGDSGTLAMPAVHLDAGAGWQFQSGSLSSTSSQVYGGGLQWGGGGKGAVKDSGFAGLGMLVDMSFYNVQVSGLNSDGTSRGGYYFEGLFGPTFRPRDFYVPLGAYGLRPTLSAAGGFIAGSAAAFGISGQLSAGLIFERYPGLVDYKSGEKVYYPIFSIEAVGHFLPFSDSGGSLGNSSGGFGLRITFFPSLL